MGKHKDVKCPIKGCKHWSRGDNMVRHLRAHANGTLKHTPSIYKHKPKRLEFK